MLRPSVLNLRFHPTFFALVLQIAHRAENSMRRRSLVTLFAPSLHAIMHIEIIRPFQRHRNIQKHPVNQSHRYGIKR